MVSAAPLSPLISLKPAAPNHKRRIRPWCAISAPSVRHQCAISKGSVATLPQIEPTPAD
jgi:hypothetical protein